MNSTLLINTKETAFNTVNEGVKFGVNTVINAKHLSCSCEGYHIYDITIADEIEVSVVRQGENNFLRNATTTEEKIRTSNGAIRSYENFTKDYIIVEMGLQTAYELSGKTLYVNHSTGKVVKEPTEGYRAYAMLMYTSSSVKKCKTIWYDKSIAKSNMDIINVVIPHVIGSMNQDLSLNA